MNQYIITQNNARSLVLFFAGWGMDCQTFANMKLNCDFMIVCNYENFDFDIDLVKNYDNIYVFAWSFGVYAASHVLLSNQHMPVVFKMAINGTQFPIDDTKGIPLRIFQATANNLSHQSLLKFYRRICSDTNQYETFLSHMPQRTLSSLSNELKNIETTFLSSTPNPIKWDKVLVSKNDRIFPFENQLKGWCNLCRDMEIDERGAHMPTDFEKIISQNIINKNLIKQRFSSSFETGYDSNARVQKEIAKTLFLKWENSIGLKQDASILEFGCGTGFFTRTYLSHLYPSRLVLNDICNMPTITLNLNTTDYEFIEGDAEQLSFPPGTFDYIVSSSAIQWFENIPFFLEKASNWLKPGGALVISSFGPRNMIEIKNIAKISLNYKDTDWFYTKIKRNFDIILIDEESKVLLFDSPIDALKHIKATGVNSVNSERLATKNVRNLLDNYPEDINGKFPLTYNPIYIIAKKNG